MRFLAEAIQDSQELDSYRSVTGNCDFPICQATSAPSV
jgi:hypothetical protein